MPNPMCSAKVCLLCVLDVIAAGPSVFAVTTLGSCSFAPSSRGLTLVTDLHANFLNFDIGRHYQREPYDKSPKTHGAFCLRS